MNALQRLQKLATWVVLVGSGFFLLMVVQVVLWAADRDAPFVMLDYSATPVHRGEMAVIKAVVKRDSHRKCGVTFSRSFVDSKGIRFYLEEGVQMMNARSMEILEQRSPGTSTFGLKVPQEAAPGVATINTSLDYVCNPIHNVYPVQMVLTMNLEVLP